MSVHEADQIQALLTLLMDRIHDDATLHAEVARAQREFFQSNPRATQDDPSSRFRFQEWYLLQRESEVLGAVPLRCMKMSDEERETLTDSLVGVFRVTGVHPAEYMIEDLQDHMIHDLSRIDGADLAVGDVLVGRLFEGSLDVFLASPVMSCQREASALAMAFQRDVANLGLDRRLTQAELEHLLFRGRGSGAPEPAPDDIPLERIEADLEACLERGGAQGHSATAISAALRHAARPGMIMNPLLQTIAFDTDIDIEAVQRLIWQIWNYHQTHAAPSPQESGSIEAEADPSALGEAVARRLREGLSKGEKVTDVFADIERMANIESDPSYTPETVDLNADHVPATAKTGDAIEGDLRPLIAEYLWETKRRGIDVTVLEQLVVTQCEASVPRMDLEAVTSADLFRLLLQAYLESAPGERASAVGQSFAALQRFYAWVEKTQIYELAAVIDAVRAIFVDHVARLESAGLTLSGSRRPESGETAHNVLTVISVTEHWIEVDPDSSDSLVRIEIPPGVGDNLRKDDLLLATLEARTDSRGSFDGMVVALPKAAASLLG